MSTRDLGKHVVELHEEGMLAITGEGARLTLSPHEAVDFLNWLNQHRKTLETAARAHATEEVPEILQEETAEPITDPDDREYPVDEP
ncbi:hypothetical protein [Dictyobacter formicarum]|uniref:TubC N-terminal docking domain-containing protein n=1 Tax=Dictyobacter formicarum TaxID=2778368 RepID=A0ABQ3VDE2_9CHLR|nr:hypothetical protein [Dictyobacter formicarum]GHO83833.1 hypothetical protein KSZ_18390 [Dictyobacter formicarum]